MRTQYRITPDESAIRRTQPLLEKLIVRSATIEAESRKLGQAARGILAKRLADSAHRMRTEISPNQASG